jgi:hypothetical protein
MHVTSERRSIHAGAVRGRWRTHLYIAAIAVLGQASSFGQSPARELLNSERIAARFGHYAVEVLEQDAEVRVSNLYSAESNARTCRTFAIVRFATTIDPAIRAEHAEIVAGGSIGAVFAAAGWEVRKTHLSYGQQAATALLASLMRIDPGTPLAEHAYVLDVVKAGRAIEYAALLEIHHPDYLGLDDLTEIYGPAEGGRGELVERLRATAAERIR